MKKYIALVATFLVLGAGCSTISPDASRPVVPKATSEVRGGVMDLSGQGLSSLPQSVLDARNVKQLDISNNKMTGALPAEIRHLTTLEVLNASHNGFTGIPAEIGQLSRLRVLNFSNNTLTGIPHELGNLQNLELLDLSGNDISQQDLEVIRAALPESVEIRL